MVRARRTSSTDKTAEKTKSFNDWGKLDEEALSLECNQYLIQTGNKIEMQRRLHNFFKNKNGTASSSTSSSSEVVPQENTNNQTSPSENIITSPVTINQQNDEPSPITTETSQLREEMKELKVMMFGMQHRTVNNHENGGNNVPPTTLYSPTLAAEAPSQPFLSPSFNQNTAEITDNQSRLYSFQSFQLQSTPSSGHPSNASPATISHPDQNAVHFNIGTNQYGVPGNFNNHIVNNLYTSPAVDEKIMTKTLKAEYPNNRSAISRHPSNIRGQFQHNNKPKT